MRSQIEYHLKIPSTKKGCMLHKIRRLNFLGQLNERGVNFHFEKNHVRMKNYKWKNAF